MADSGSFGVSRNDTGDRFRNYLNMHRHQNQVVQQHRLRSHDRHHQLPEIAVAVSVADADADSDDSTAALPARSLISASPLSSPSRRPTNITNLSSFLDSVTPIVAAQKSSETSVRKDHPYYCLGDLWETFGEWSAYGAGVPLLLFGRHPTTQYYVPFLSGMQLYIDPQNPHMNHRCPGEGNDVNRDDGSCVMKFSSGSSSPSSSSSSSRGRLVFEYMEQEQPRARTPLADKVSKLASEFPELINYRSCDLSPSSWICVAWYPIYRIPMGPTLKDLDASFLTIHSLSTQPGCDGEAEGEDKEIRLPVIGLASYKLKGSIISPYAPQECQQENALLEAATNWLRNLQALLLDYQFFLNRYPHWRR